MSKQQNEMHNYEINTLYLYLSVSFRHMIELLFSLSSEINYKYMIYKFNFLHKFFIGYIDAFRFIHVKDDYVNSIIY